MLFHLFMNSDVIFGIQCGTSVAPATFPDRLATYSLYGLRVRSDLPLPLTPVAAYGADLVIHFTEPVSLPHGPVFPTMTRTWQQQGDQWVLRFQSSKNQFFEFVYDLKGEQIMAQQGHPEWQDILFVLMGASLAAALYLRGRPAFHAASLVKDGNAFLLMGSGGQGKSTLAMALTLEGLQFHSDDIGALTWDSGRPVVQAGYSRLKIMPRTADALGCSADALLPIFIANPDHPEKWLDASILRGGFHDGPAPLKAIYLLSGRRANLRAPIVETLLPSHGAMALARHFYGQPWLAIPAEYMLSICTRVAETTPIRRLQLPDGLDRLRSSARTVMTDMEP